MKNHWQEAILLYWISTTFEWWLELSTLKIKQTWQHSWTNPAPNGTSKLHQMKSPFWDEPLHLLFFSTPQTIDSGTPFFPNLLELGHRTSWLSLSGSIDAAIPRNHWAKVATWKEATANHVKTETCFEEHIQTCPICLDFLCFLVFKTQMTKNSLLHSNKGLCFWRSLASTSSRC